MGTAKTPGYDGPEGTEWPGGQAAFEDTGSIPVVADDTKPCDTCGKTHRPDDCAHSEVLG